MLCADHALFRHILYFGSPNKTLWLYWSNNTQGSIFIYHPIFWL